MTYDAVVLDLDGVVVERTPSWVFDDAAAEALAAFGIEDPSEEAYQLVRMPPAATEAPTRLFNQEYDVAFADLLAKRGELITAKQLEAIHNGEKTVYPDVEALAELPAPRAIVSNNLHAAVENALEAFDLTRLFDTWYGVQPEVADLTRRKPDPTYLHRALDDLDATTALYVGDRESDIEVARRAGADSAFVRRSFNADADLDPAPTYDVDSLEALAPRVKKSRSSH